MYHTYLKTLSMSTLKQYHILNIKIWINVKTNLITMQHQILLIYSMTTHILYYETRNWQKTVTVEDNIFWSIKNIYAFFEMLKLFISVQHPGVSLISFGKSTKPLLFLNERLMTMKRSSRIYKQAVR